MSSKRRNNFYNKWIADRISMGGFMKRFTFEIVSKLFLKIKLILQNIHVKNKWSAFSSERHRNWI